VFADSLLIKQQVLYNCSRQHSPDLLVHDRFLPGFRSLYPGPRRILRTAFII